MRYDADGNPTGYVDHIATGLDRLIARYRNSPRVRAWLTAYLLPIQRLEDGFWDLFTMRFLDNAEGALLTAWGRYVGEPRNGITDDEEYRVHVRIRVLVNRSDATLPELLTIANLASGYHLVRSYQFQPASVVIQLDAPPAPPISVTDIVGWLRGAKAAGVKLQLVHAPEYPGMRWASADPTGFQGTGWASALGTPGVGGNWYGVR